MQMADLTMTPLLKKMKGRNLLSDETSQYHSYQMQANIVTLFEDEDIQNAVWEVQAMGATSLRIQVTSTDDLG